MKRIPLAILCSLLWVTQVRAGENLLANGDFELGGAEWTGLSGSASVGIGAEGANHFLTVTNSAITTNVAVQQKVKVQADQWLEFKGRVRVKSLTTDHKANWHNARIQTTWNDSSDKALTVWPPSPNFDNPTGSWVEFHQYMKVPAAAVTLIVAPALFYSTGEVDFDDLVLKVVSEDAVPEDIRSRGR